MKLPLSIKALTPPLRAATAAALHDDGQRDDLRPTHCFTRDGDVVAAVSLFAPIAMFWAHSKRMNPRESFETVRRCHALAMDARPDYLVVCWKTSPFHPLMERLGYRKLGGADFFEPR
jgi:hypothetical protein